eukprot:5410748-Pleurochrysis_carterae.AAC.1
MADSATCRIQKVEAFNTDQAARASLPEARAPRACDSKSVRRPGRRQRRAISSRDRDVAPRHFGSLAKRRSPGGRTCGRAKPKGGTRRRRG